MKKGKERPGKKKAYDEKRRKGDQKPENVHGIKAKRERLNRWKEQMMTEEHD